MLQQGERSKRANSKLYTGVGPKKVNRKTQDAGIEDSALVGGGGVTTAVRWWIHSNYCLLLRSFATVRCRSILILSPLCLPKIPPPPSFSPLVVFSSVTLDSSLLCRFLTHFLFGLLLILPCARQVILLAVFSCCLQPFRQAAVVQTIGSYTQIMFTQQAVSSQPL